MDGIVSQSTPEHVRALSEASFAFLAEGVRLRRLVQSRQLVEDMSDIFGPLTQANLQDAPDVNGVVANVASTVEEGPPDALYTATTSKHAQSQEPKHSFRAAATILCQISLLF